MVSRAIKVQYSPEALLAYVLSCVIDDKGVPRFMVKIFGMPLPENEVLVTCRDFDDVDLLPPIRLVGVPKEIRQIVEEVGHRDLAEWKKVLASILTPSEIQDIVQYLKKAIRSKDVPLMIKYAYEIKTKKVPEGEAKEIAEAIAGPYTFLDYLEHKI